MAGRRYLPGLFLLFVGSGCAALVYEIVWFQLLQLVIGSSAISLGILLGTFMGGMCLGSLALPRAISPRQHPLRVYAVFELAIGVLAILILFDMPLVGGLYAAAAGSGITGIVFRAVVAGICLLPPTMLMGATLPAISRYVKATPEGVAWLGFFYGGNIAGGVIGSLAAGFYLLRVYDVQTATLTAAAINAAVGLLALLFAAQTPYDVRDGPPTRVDARVGGGSVYVTIAISGLTALAAEVVWTRTLSLLFGGTVYTFAQILAVFLVGLGIGSTVAAAITRGAIAPRRALGGCQLLLCGALAWAAFQLNASLPFWPINPSLATNPWFTFQLDLVRCMWVVLPGAVLWGASFPLALASLATREQDAARLAGGVYAANTVGAILGSLITSFILVPAIGSQHTQQVLIILSAVAALVMLEPGVDKRRASLSGDPADARLRVSRLWRFGEPRRSCSGGRRASRDTVASTCVLATAMIAAGVLARRPGGHHLRRRRDQCIRGRIGAVERRA
jgi:spermidine synthase